MSVAYLGRGKREAALFRERRSHEPPSLSGRVREECKLKMNVRLNDGDSGGSTPPPGTNGPG
ncbi:hypothetical protein GCM10014719_52550 [Planomonospora parontospora subsp. antibiotica]|nr:hypothetical protein GCM10014719_52550 [Planomonospora parontospora subsp. antibiotica]GII19686.1 hypothetical protein Ppa05_64120 [Planomonospora parontospora subsp. antibiotica]